MPVELSEGKKAEATASATPAAPVAPTPPFLTPLDAATTPAVLPARCANCESTLTGPFCAQCGQHAADFHRSLWRLITGFFDNVFSWDSKFFRTLGPLMTRPGFLTREFLLGRRTRYVHPLRLFLFTSAVCLTLLQFGHHKTIKAGSGAGKNGVHVNFGDPDKDDKDDEDDDGKPSPSPGPSPAASASPAAAGGSASPAASPASSPAASATPRAPRQNKPADNAFERYMEDFAKRVDSKSKQLGQEEFGRQVSAKMQSSLSWIALTMLPFFALLLRSLYWRRDSYYFDHLIYSLHYHTFLLLLMTAYRGVDGFLDWTHLAWLKIPLLLGLLMPPWYLYCSLRTLFGQSPLRTGVKVFVIGALHLIALVIGMTIVGLSSVFSVI